MKTKQIIRVYEAYASVFKRALGELDNEIVLHLNNFMISYSQYMIMGQSCDYVSAMTHLKAIEKLREDKGLYINEDPIFDELYTAVTEITPFYIVTVKNKRISSVIVDQVYDVIEARKIVDRLNISESGIEFSARNITEVFNFQNKDKQDQWLERNI